MSFDAGLPVVVVTGASTGIGRATARELLEHGRQVIGTGRDPQRTASAEAELTASAGGGARFAMLRADFTSMAEVVRTADEIQDLTPRLDVLINNAGGVRNRRIVTPEGTEATFAANHLAPFLLTRRLLPLLRATAGVLAPGSVRVINVSSSSHRSTDGLDWDDLQSFRVSHPVTGYCRAKLACLLFTRELARREAPYGVVAQAMHPGVVASNFASHGDKVMRAHMAAADMVPPEVPAGTLVWLATSSEGGRDAGRYFHDKAEETPSRTALDDSAASRLWTETETLLARLGH